MSARLKAGFDRLEHEIDRRIAGRAAASRQTIVNDIRTVYGILAETAVNRDDVPDWILSKPLPALGRKTVMDLVCAGRTDLVMRFLEHRTHGAYA